jgi:hypothetical protein
MEILMDENLTAQLVQAMAESWVLRSVAPKVGVLAL